MSPERLDFPSSRRNAPAILAVLKSELSLRTRDVLEIASGSGQHGVHFCTHLPDLIWWPSDLDPLHIKSINAWRRHGELEGRIMPAQMLDVCDEDRLARVTRKKWPSYFDAILNINMIHISPWSATQGLMRLAGQCLGVGGALILYGPYRKGGKHTAPSNAAFDQSLRERNSDWGVRNMEDVILLARGRGLKLRKTVPMPANNFCLVFERAK